MINRIPNSNQSGKSWLSRMANLGGIFSKYAQRSAGQSPSKDQISRLKDEAEASGRTLLRLCKNVVPLTPNQKRFDQVLKEEYRREIKRNINGIILQRFASEGEKQQWIQRFLTKQEKNLKIMGLYDWVEGRGNPIKGLSDEDKDLFGNVKTKILKNLTDKGLTLKEQFLKINHLREETLSPKALKLKMFILDELGKQMRHIKRFQIKQEAWLAHQNN